MPRGDEVAYADNWRTVLAVDAALGVSIAVTGIVLVVVRGMALGFLLAVAGAVYVVFVIKRFLRWKSLRAEAATRPPRE